MRYIGLDMDGVIADTDTLLRAFLEEWFGRSVSREEITSFYYEDCLGMSAEDTKRLWDIFHRERGWENIARVEGAHRALAELRKHFKLAIITSRPEYLYDVTHKWLTTNTVPFDDLVVTSTMTKSDVIRNKGWKLDYFVEDRHDFAEDIAQLGIKVFLLDYPWNRDFKKDIPVIQRVSNWDEIVQHVMQQQHVPRQ